MEQTIPVISFSPFPELQSDRLLLRRLSTEDVHEVFALRSDPETMKYIPRPLAKTKKDASLFIDMINKAVDDNAYIHWAICKKTEPTLVGMICLIELQPENFRATLGYILDPAARHQGLMQEAVHAVINYAFQDLKLHSLQAEIDPRNTASERVLQKLNFVKEAHFKESKFWKGEFLDDVFYSLRNS
jgi:ribosomal-protein-alanine N-acetyltransferase